jgi:pantoate--beta-alanine ligase
MRIVHSIADLRAALAGGAAVNLVPTMGNLHAGHLSLVAAARARPGVTVTSIFVNRLQFGPQDDYSRYPRTLERDCALLADAGCDVVFAPGDDVIYPQPQEYTVVPPRGLAEILEGAARPGFFVGVCTVVLKLFNLVGPRAAFFGRKDYQQLLIVQRMAAQLALGIDIVGCETVRDASGLALSSRNGYLTPAELAEAPELARTLRRVAAAARTTGEGAAAWQRLGQDALQSLRSRGWEPDYVAVRRSDDLGVPAPGDALIVLGAARLGGARLIDNIAVT